MSLFILRAIKLKGETEFHVFKDIEGNYGEDKVAVFNIPAGSGIYVSFLQWAAHNNHTVIGENKGGSRYPIHDPNSTKIITDPSEL
jgi:hypothetical protein